MLGDAFSLGNRQPSRQLAFARRAHRMLPGRAVRNPFSPRPTMPTFKAVPAADLDLLRKFDTPTICNVVELFDLRPRTAGYLSQRIQACYPKLPPMVGYAATATFRSAAPPRSGNVYSGLAE